MPITDTKLKLGKGSAFVKSRLRPLPQYEDIWEADIQPVVDEQDEVEFWMGMVIDQEHGAILAIKTREHSPTVNDLADLLYNAMYRPLTDDRQHRPATILLRQNPVWDELLRHLQELRIEVVSTDALPAWTEAANEYGIGQARFYRSLAGKPTSRSNGLLETSFPTISKWVARGGWIEIGEQDGIGFVARAIDAGGMVFEDNDATTLDEAMAGLERGIASWLEEQDIDLG